MKFDGIELLEGGNARNLVVASGSSFPTSPDEGELFFRSDSGVLFVYANSGWTSCSSNNGEVSAFNGRTGNITLTGTDITNALGFSPANSASAITVAVTSLNGRTGAVTLTLADVTGALGYTPADAADTLTSGDISTALGYTPADASNLIDLSTTVPQAPGSASVGTATTAARADHVHPLQTSISGNAGTATSLETARTIAVTGAVTGSATFDGSANTTITTTLAGTKVDSFNTRTGAVTLTGADVTGALGYTPQNSASALTLGSSVGAAAGTASAGTATTAARSDHVHPLQTSVSGNAGTATALATARTINGVSFDGTSNITINAVDSTARIASTEKGAANGVVPLNSSSTIDSIYLPSYVDDVLEFNSFDVFPASGTTGKIYVAIDTGKIYRWTGSVFIEISPTAGNADTATKLATARTIAVSGAVTGSAAFDGSANATITTTLAGTKVDSFNTRTGAVTLTGADVTGALGYTPPNVANATTFTNGLNVTGSNFGVGTSSPQYPLDVVTTSASGQYTGTSTTLIKPDGTLGAIENNTQQDNSFAGLTYAAKMTNGTTSMAYVGVTTSSANSGYSGALVFGRRTGLTAYDESARFTGAGYFGIGTVSPNSKFTVNYNASTSTIAVPGVGGNYATLIGADGQRVRHLVQGFNEQAGFTGSVANGTPAAPTAVDSNSVLAFFNGWGHNGTTYQHAAAVNIVPETTWTGSSTPGVITFVTNNGTTLSEVARFTSSGQFALGTTTPGTSKVYIKGSNATDALVKIENTNPAGASGIVAVDTTGTKYFTAGVINDASTLEATTFGDPGEGFIRASTSANGLAINSANASYPIRFRIGTGSTSEKMRIASSGRVGIGVVTPSGKLDVTGESGHATAQSGAVVITAGANSTTNSVGGITLKSTQSTTGSYSPALAFDVGGGGGRGEIYTTREGSYGGTMSFSTDSYGTASTTATRLSISPNNVVRSLGSATAIGDIHSTEYTSTVNAISGVASSTGGTLPAGTYYALVVPKFDSSFGPLSAVSAGVTTTGSTSSITWTTEYVPYASGLRIFIATSPASLTAGTVVGYFDAINKTGTTPQIAPTTTSTKIPATNSTGSMFAAGAYFGGTANSKITGLSYSGGLTDHFTYDTDKIIGNYNITWKQFSDYSGAPGMAISSYGGIKSFTKSQLRTNLTTDGYNLIGGSLTPRSVGGTTALVQIESDANQPADGSISIVKNSTDLIGAKLTLGKSGGTTAGSVVAPATDSELGEVAFAAANATNINAVVASVSAVVTDPSSSTGYLAFNVRNASGSKVNYSRIYENGYFEHMGEMSIVGALSTSLTISTNGLGVTQLAPPTGLSGVASTGGSLAAGTYYARLVAYDNAGNTVVSSSYATVSGVSAGGRITWSWESLSGAISYRVYVSTSSAAMAGVGPGQYFETTGTSYVQTSLSGSPSYWSSQNMTGASTLDGPVGISGPTSMASVSATGTAVFNGVTSVNNSLGVNGALTATNTVTLYTGVSMPTWSMSAPSITPATTGGTIPAGTYYIKLAYVNANGYCITPVGAYSVTTTGSTGSINITCTDGDITPKAGSLRVWVASSAAALNPGTNAFYQTFTTVTNGFYVLTSIPSSTSAIINSTNDINTISSSGRLIVSNTSASTGSNSGAAVISGGLGVSGNIYSGSNILAGSTTGLIGYGATQAQATQATSRTTGVTVNASSGVIQLVSAATTAGSIFTFTVTNSTVTAKDVVQVSLKGTTGLYFCSTTVAAGSFNISVYTPTAQTAESFFINFVVIKGGI